MTLAAGLADGSVALLDWATGALRRSIPAGHENGTAALAFSGGLLFTGGTDGLAAWQVR